jgi:pyridoxamine 5'-phosphate oxidase
MPDLMGDPRSMQAPTGHRMDRPLDRDDLDPNPFAQFQVWLDAAEDEGISLPNAMTVATADADGRPSVRHVLLRGLDDRGFTFFTNRESRKGRQLAENPHAGLCFLWKELDRQVSVTGSVELVDEEESDAYFATRPREARLGAWASAQSTVLRDREQLEARLADAEARHMGGEVPRPPYWGGYRVIPDTIEFWQGRQHRLHDRFVYTRDAGARVGWRLERLSP